MPLVMVEARAVSVTISTLNKSCDAVYLEMACTGQERSDSRKNEVRRVVHTSSVVRESLC